MPHPMPADRPAPLPLSVPEFGGREWEYVKSCLDTGWVSSAGPFVDRFESEFSSKVGSKHSVAVASGTAALHVALLVAGVQPEDEVLVSTLSFIAPANAIRYVGAWPVFVDAEPDFWQMDPERVAEFLNKKCRLVDGALRNIETGRRVSAIIPVHILGHPADVLAICEIARKFGLQVIEDASESLGALVRDRHVGTFGDVACFSFNGNKLITTGGGGMIVTDRTDWAERARYLTTQAKDDPVEYVHGEIGYNYRLTNVQAAMGCAQLEQLETYLDAKRRTAETYTTALRRIDGIRIPQVASWARSAFWLFTIQVEGATFGRDSREVLKELAELDVQTRPLWQPLHLSRAHSGSTCLGGEVASHLYKECLSLPCSVGITLEETERVIAGIAALKS
jgi:perosamine synthetase